MQHVPFTVNADIDLGVRVAPYLSDGNADVIIAQGEVPENLKSKTGGGIAYDVTQTEFLLRLPNGTRYLVRNGDEIIYHRGDNVSDRDIVLFLLGSAWGALCYQRGLLPLHASAVTVNGRVYAFTGHSGAGKSTLSAALADREAEFFTDDVLIINPATISDQAICYAGQKDLKLWKNSLKMTNAKKMGPVRDAEGFEKYFAMPANSASPMAGSLAALLILTKGKKLGEDSPADIQKIAGGAALKQLSSSIYRPLFAEKIWGRKKLYEALAQLIGAIEIYQFSRPFIDDKFSDGLNFADKWIHDNAEKAAAQ